MKCDWVDGLDNACQGCLAAGLQASDCMAATKPPSNSKPGLEPRIRSACGLSLPPSQSHITIANNSQDQTLFKETNDSLQTATLHARKRSYSESISSSVAPPSSFSTTQSGPMVLDIIDEGDEDGMVDNEDQPVEQNTVYRSEGWQSFVGVLHMDDSESDNEEDESSSDKLAESGGYLEFSDDGGWSKRKGVRGQGQGRPAAPTRSNSQKPVSSADSDAKTDPETCGECGHVLL